MKNYLAFASISLALVSTPVQASKLGGLLDGMFVNISSPTVVDNGLRGSIAGGSAYIRTPVTSLQVIAMDPPRFSAGCGGIDLYFGSFSFISGEKLTQFIRSVAQNAAPLAFKLAIDKAFPQLGGLLDKFQQISQQMNDLMKNSCQLAQGLVTNGPSSFEALTKSVTATFETAKGWAEDIAKAAEESRKQPSSNVKRVQDCTLPNGSLCAPEIGNTLWNALDQRTKTGMRFDIASNEVMSKQIIMSLIGTTVTTASKNQNEEPSVRTWSSRLSLNQLVYPIETTTGVRGIPVYFCDEVTKCLNITERDFVTYGVAGYVRENLFGSQTARVATADSIVAKMKNCTTPNCGLTASQRNFLESIGNINAIAFLRRAQHLGGAFDQVANILFTMIVDEVAVVYGEHVLDIARSTYSGTKGVKVPDDFFGALERIDRDLAEIRSRQNDQIGRIEQVAKFIDLANRTTPGLWSYRQ